MLLDTVPPADAVLASAPAELVLRFNEPVRPIVIRVLRAEDGEPLGADAIEAMDTALHVPLPEGLSEGTYVVSYRVTSADGHPVAGSFVFTVGAASALPASPLIAADRYDGFWVWAGVVARALHYAHPAARRRPRSVPRIAACAARPAATAAARRWSGWRRSASAPAS